MDIDLLKYILPSELLSHFTIVGLSEYLDKSTNISSLYISLEEQNVLPSGYDHSHYESKGFYPEKQIQDFPIRGKSVYLLIRRRRWRNKDNPSEIIHNDYSFIAEGSKLTKELSDFLKGTGRYPRRYNQ